MSDKIPDFNFNLSISDGFEDDNQAFKFDLFLKTREIQQINSSLRHVTLLPKRQQQAWVKSNQDLIHKYMDNLTQDMFEVLDDMSLDRDAIQETISCVTQLRELVTMLNSLMTDQKKFRLKGVLVGRK